MLRRRILAAVTSVLVAGAGGGVSAQSLGAVQSQVLTIETEQVYRRSAFGRRINAELEAASAELAAENRQIEAELTIEEKDLTEKRAELPPEEFSALADAFDEKVRSIRREQDRKARTLSRKQEEGRDQFLRAAAPVLEDMMRESGAAVVLDRRGVFLSLTAVDITEAAIARIDNAIGDGADAQE